MNQAHITVDRSRQSGNVGLAAVPAPRSDIQYEIGMLFEALDRIEVTQGELAKAISSARRNQEGISSGADSPPTPESNPSTSLGEQIRTARHRVHAVQQRMHEDLLALAL